MGIQLIRNEFAKLVGQGINFPSVHEARWLTDSVKHSPDLGYLEQFEYQLLFCGDDTKLNHSHHCLIEDNQFIANAFTSNYFNYWQLETVNKHDQLERLPIPMQTTILKHTVRYFPPPLKIAGQLFAVRPYQFRELDNYKQNRVQFQRKRVNLIVPYRPRWYKTNDELEPTQKLPKALQGTKHYILGDERVFIIRAWMYVGRPDYWDNLLDAGFRGFKTVNTFESRREWLRDYYAYPKRPIKI